VPVIALDDDRERAMQVVEAEIRTAIRQDFINSVVLGCAGMVHMTDNRGDTSFKLIDGVEAAVCFVRML
jgi:allantoin racemase